jgi:hypothetical protein
MPATVTLSELVEAAGSPEPLGPDEGVIRVPQSELTNFEPAENRVAKTPSGDVFYADGSQWRAVASDVELDTFQARTEELIILDSA